MIMDQAALSFWPADISGGKIDSRTSSAQAAVAGTPELADQGRFKYLNMTSTGYALRFTLPAMTEFTYAAWMRYPNQAIGAYYHHLLTFDADQLRWLLKRNVGGVTPPIRAGEIYHFSENADASTPVGVIPEQQAWFFVTARFDGTTMTVSINGVEEGSAIPHANPIPPGIYSIGRPSSLTQASESTAFQLGPVMIFDRCLSKQEEIQLISEFYADEPEAPEPASKSSVSGLVQIDGNPAARTVRAFSYDAITHDVDGAPVLAARTLGEAKSDPETGAYTIDLLGGYPGDVFVVAFDDYGRTFAPGLPMAIGDRVHPTQPNGYVYECDAAGTLPEEEPVWSTDTNTSQLVGTASVIARPFYRPVVHGPVKPVVMEPEEEGDS